MIYLCPECRGPLDRDTTTYIQLDVDEWTWRLGYDDVGLKLQPDPTFYGIETEGYYVRHACGARIACASDEYVTFDANWLICTCGQLNTDGETCIGCGMPLDESDGRL